MQPYLFKLATTPAEITAYFNLRRSIFVEEQGVFADSDTDELDAIAYPIIATVATSDSQRLEPDVLGVVRIYEPQPKLWYGGRLGVHREYRRVGRIGQGLIYKAVTTANAWGCERFLATVQLQNVRFFQRLHWTSLEEVTLCGRSHHLMEADLNYYPATMEVRPALTLHAEAS